MDLLPNLAIVLGLAAVGGIIARLLRQPALLGYVAAGVGISYFNLVSGHSSREYLETLGQLGVTLLLFLVGLELPISELRRMGKVALATGVGQIIFTTAVGYFLIKLLGFNSVTSLYLAIALAFSSTIIIVKLLSEKKDLGTLYGKIAVGFLLVQDFIAIGLLVVLSGFSQGDFNLMSLVMVVVKALVMVVTALWLSTHVFPRLLKAISSNTEILFVGTLAWCLVVAAVVASPWIGFGVEIGGFVAGLALANAAAHWQIVARVRPLRDFFLTLFFVSLGANIQMGNLAGLATAALVLSAFILIGNPLIVMVIMGVMGYKRRTSFLASVTVAQISEFSLIVIAMAVRIGHVSEQVLALTAIVGVITMTVSSYMILYAERLYAVLQPVLGIFEKASARDTNTIAAASFKKHIVLFGFHRVGEAILESLKALPGELVIVDYNPEVVERLTAQGETAQFGDVADIEVYDQVNLSQAVAIVSTVADIRDNLMLLEYVRSLKQRPLTIIVAQDSQEAELLAKAGVDYTLVPHTVGGEYLSHIFKHHGLEKSYWQKKLVHSQPNLSSSKA